MKLSPISKLPTPRRLPAAFLALLLSGLAAHAATFVQPTSITGTTPSGILWSAVVTGTAMPVTGTSAAAGSPGAVVYFDTTTGQVQVDPKGLDLTTLIITYGTGTTNISGTSPGPFVYPTGTGTNAISPTTGTPRTFPAVTAVTGLPPTTFAARVAMTIGASIGPSLATSGDAGNIASTTGFWNRPWAFPTDLVASGSAAVMSINNFYTVGQATNPNINKLGYGNGRATFQYSANGVVGIQVGAVIPYTSAPAATISATPSSLGNFTTTTGTPSASQSFTVNGTGLTANITATAPANFQLSSDNSTFSSNLTLTQSGGNVTATTLYTRLAASAPTGPLSGNITLASTGATTQNVALSGTVAALPLISVTPSSLVGFATTTGSASGSQSLTINGTSLTANLTISAPTGFQVSLDNSTFSSSIQLAPTGGTVTDTTIHTRIAASAPAGSVSGNLVISSPGAATESVALSGTVGSIASLATLDTTPVSSSIRTTTATLGGEVTADGGAAITARGVVYSLTATDSDPQVGGSSVTNLPATGTTGVFSVNATALTPGAAYSFKAYATNSAGTSYSTAGTFTALRPVAGWRLSNFGDVVNSGNGADAASPAGDGIPNLVKYALCLDPAQWGGLPQPEIANNRLKMSFQRDPARSDITITVEGTSDLVNAPWVPVATSLAGGAFSGNGSVSETPLQGGLQQVEVSDSVDTLTDPRRRFLRIHTTLPAE